MIQAVFILYALAAHAHSGDLATHDTGHAQEWTSNLAGESVGFLRGDLVSGLISKLFGRTNKAVPIRPADMDETSLGSSGHIGVGSPLRTPFAVQPSRSSIRLPSSSLPLEGLHARAQPGNAFGNSVSFWNRLRRSPHVARAVEAAEKEATEGETYQFQAEVGRIMNIIVNSIYSDRDVFLRELISNSADALEKKRFVALSDQSKPAEEGRVMVRADKERRILYIEDSGIGMSKEELIENLGRIAKSGTAKFMEAMKQNNDVSLIGQFGVGFYSAFLVADQVTVTTRSFKEGNALHQWQSVPGDFGNFKIKDVEFFGGNSTLEEMSSGTQIALKLKDDAGEYLEQNTLSRLMKKFSEFTPFPINLWSQKTEYVQVPDGNKTNEDGSVKMKSEAQQRWDYEVLNKMKPLWVREPSSVSKSDYNEFYKTTFKAFDEPLCTVHFSAEGQIEFRALIFIPRTVPFELTQNMFDESGRAMRLYVKRVFINDKFEDIVPRWLTFVRGVVDSDDLPLNVGREILQKSKTLTVIRKRVTRKVLDSIEEMAEKEPDNFKTLFDNYGKFFKVGLIEDADAKAALTKVVRFYSSKTGDNTTNLPGYVSRMGENQTKIYYVTGESRKSAETAPALEKMIAKNLEVLYMVDPLDEILVQNVGEFQGKRLVDINKGDLDLGGETEAEKTKKNITSMEYGPLMKWMGTTLREKVKEVKLSDRLTDSPAVIVQAEWGMSPTMQRYMRAQASARGDTEQFRSNENAAAILEINPEHPIVKKMKAAYTANSASTESIDLANVIYEIAALTGGYQIDDTASFAKRVSSLVTSVAKS